MSSSSFSFSSSDEDEGNLAAERQQGEAGDIAAAEGRLVVAIAPRDAGSNKYRGSEGREQRKEHDDQRRERKKKDRSRRRRRKKKERKRDRGDRKKSKRKRHHRESRSRSRSRSRSSSDDGYKRQRDRRKRRKDEDGEHDRPASRALVVVEGDDTAQSKIDPDHQQEQKEKRLPRPSTSRSFASVSKSVHRVPVRPKSPELLMIEDGRGEDHGTRGQAVGGDVKGGGSAKQPIDMVQAYRDHVFNTIDDADEKMKERRRLFLPLGYDESTAEESDLSQSKYMERQRRLNEMIKSDPNDEDAWMALANFHLPEQHGMPTSQQSKRQDMDSKKELAGLERKRELLTRAMKHNMESIVLRVALISTLERLCLLSAIEDKEIEMESDNAIRFFELLAAGEMKDNLSPNIGPTKVKDLIHLHRMRLRRLPCTKGSRFDANRMRESFIEAFTSVSKVHGDKVSFGPELTALFLDYLRMEALMGYSERAVAMIQAALEMNLHRHATRTGLGGDRAWEASFFDYWNSETPRIGDAFPRAGWLEWKESKRNAAIESIGPGPTAAGREKEKEFRNKMTRRMKASDFFGGDDTSAAAEDASLSVADQGNGEATTSSQIAEKRRQNLVGAYESAASQPYGPSAPNQCVESVDRVLSVARSEVEKQQEKQRRLEQGDSFDEDDGRSGVKSSTISVEAIAAQGGEVIPSQIQDDRASIVQVYSFLHHRRIEVSKEELSGEATKNSLRRTLKLLRQKKKDAKDGDSSGTRLDSFKPSSEAAKLYLIHEDNGFLQWSTEEVKSQDLFLPPLRSSQEPEPEYYDHNRSIWVEDGIQWIAAPFLTNFDYACGVPALLSVCLEYLGVTFRRSLLCDSYEKDRYVMGTSTSGGERLGDMSCTSPGFQQVFAGVFESASAGNSKPFSWFDVYHQLLFDESIVAFDERLFQAGEEKQMGFVRNVLHDIVSRTEDQAGDKESGIRWTSYMQVALILFESRASGDKAAEVAKGILSGTEAAKEDPRLWMAYAQLAFGLRSSKDSVDKAYKTATKILLSALEAGGSYAFHGSHSTWWMELAVMGVRSMLHLPIGPKIVSTFKVVSIDQDLRDRLLHVICCAIEGEFTAPPKTKSKSKGTPMLLVDDARLRTCHLHLQSILRKGKYGDIDALRTADPSADVFDCTPKLYHFAVLAAWMTALDSKNCDDGSIALNSGIVVLNDLASKLIASSEQRSRGPAFKICLVRIVHARLEFSLLHTLTPNLDKGTAPSFPAETFMRNILVPGIVLLKSVGLTPSKSLLCCVAFAESQIQASTQLLVCGYDSLLCPFLNYELHPNEVAYILAKATFVADRTCTTAENKDLDGRMQPDARCSRWTRDGRKRTEAALLVAIEKAGYCCYPPLWSALLRLKVLGSLSSTRKPALAFSETKTFYHESILSRCSHSKRLWLDAFTLLRPTYSEVEMIVSI